MTGEACPETGGAHHYQRDSDDFRSWVACDCGASPPNTYPRPQRPDSDDLPVLRTQADWEQADER